MPRAVLDLMDTETLNLVQGHWRRALGYVPGQPNEGLVSQLEGSPARLPSYDDSQWEPCDDLTEAFSHGFTFAWYRITVVVPEEIAGRSSAGMRCVFETCVDDYGEVWINGECDRERGTVQGFNVPQRIYITEETLPGDTHTIAILAVNGPLASPGGTVFVRYANLCFEWGGRPQDEQQGNQ